MNIPLDKFESWLKNKNLKDRTLENYLYYFNKFSINSVFDQESVARFLADKSNRNSVARSFLINYKNFLRINWKELGLSEELRSNIMNVELPKMTGRKAVRIVNPIPHEQITLIEEALPNERLKLMLLLSYYCALRLGELLKIDIMSFNWEEWAKDVEKMGECRVYGKGDKEGIALVPSFLMKRIARFIKSTPHQSIKSHIFVDDTEDTKFDSSARFWQYKLREAGIKAGITKIDGEGKPINETIIHPHKLRHSYASYLINIKGLDIKHVQEILRHSSITSTQIYVHINKEDLKEKLSS